VLAVVSGVACVLAIYWTARQITDRAGALLAGGLAATAGSLLWVTGPLAADGPALAFSVLAVGLAISARDRPCLARAAGIGLAVGAALSTKAIEAHVLVPVGLVLAAPVLDGLRRRHLDGAAVVRAVVAGAAAVGVFLAVSLPFGLSDVWDQSFGYRTDAATERDSAGNAAKMLSTLWDRDLTVLVFGVLALVFGIIAHRRHQRARAIDGDRSWFSYTAFTVNPDDEGWTPSSRLLVTSWLVTTVLWLVFVVSPLWRPHVSALIPPAVLLIAIYRPPVRASAIAAVLLVPVAIIQLDGVLWPRDYRGNEAEVVAELRALPEGAWVLSDEPGLAWRAGRRTTDDLVDPSMLRVQQGRITEDTLAEQAADPRVCAVAVRSDLRFGSFDGLPERLAAEGYEVTGTVDGPRVLYIRPDCEPTGP
jgi:4-amino-4-deoxy-L-arabinose transferase-like glycosyltransferase